MTKNGKYPLVILGVSLGYPWVQVRDSVVNGHELPQEWVDYRYSVIPEYRRFK